MTKTLLQIHEDVPADHYDKALKTNIFQIVWHHRRFHEVLKRIEPQGGKLLDIGCHSGTFTQKIIEKSKAKYVCGVDVSVQAIALAKKRIPQGKFKVADALKLPYEDNIFDIVICLEVLEHLSDPLKALKEIKRVLKKNGICIILVPTDSKMFKLIWSFWTLYYPVWKHAHVQSFASLTLENMIKKVKLKKIYSKIFNFGMLKLIVVRG